MKILKLTLLLTLLPFYFMKAQVVDTLVDERDGKIYKTVEIDGKVWMAENLNFVTSKSWCYAGKEENCDEFGRLYFLDAAQNACPAGWHLPSDDEWKELEMYLGMTEKDANKNNTWRGANEGEKLMSDTSLGFNVLLGGYRNPPANNMLKGLQAFFWTSTTVNGFGYMRQLRDGSPKIFRRTRPKSWAFSVRCVKD
jgi:uncharacterized protein (TIGR02145 family)